MIVSIPRHIIKFKRPYSLTKFSYYQGLQSYNNVIFDKKRLKLIVNVIITESGNKKIKHRKTKRNN